jgi:hypothetical protein
VDANPLAPPPATSAGQGDVDGPISWRNELPEGGGAAVAEDCTFSQGQDRSHPPSLIAWRDMSDCVHAPVHAVKATSPQTLPYRSVRESPLAQLADRHDTVLPSGHSRDAGVRGDFSVHIPNKAPRHHDSPPFGGQTRRPKDGRSAILGVSLAPWARGFLL